MRELKFRAWVYYGEKLEKPHYSNEYSLSRFFEDHDECSEDQCIEQYTGLKDKNGKEIYEGDVVKIETIKLPFLVEYHMPSASFLATTKEGLCVEFDDFYAEEDAEVVGNIHENPELVKEEE